MYYHNSNSMNIAIIIIWSVETIKSSSYAGRSRPHSTQVAGSWPTLYAVWFKVKGNTRINLTRAGNYYVSVTLFTTFLILSLIFLNVDVNCIVILILLIYIYTHTHTHKQIHLLLPPRSQSHCTSPLRVFIFLFDHVTTSRDSLPFACSTPPPTTNHLGFCFFVVYFSFFFLFLLMK